MEVETGTMIEKRKVFEDKVMSLNKEYDSWFFVVTNRNKVGSYKKYGDSIDSRYFVSKIEKLRRQIK